MLPYMPLYINALYATFSPCSSGERKTRSPILPLYIPSILAITAIYLLTGSEENNDAHENRGRMTVERKSAFYAVALTANIYLENITQDENSYACFCQTKRKGKTAGKGGRNRQTRYRAT